ncbi:MAG: acyl-ACP--UDP-N-acetylglucosamine O-acyltransferase [Hyphomicrobiales bacterium]|nr:acyl-ACP--UDP-N-acetylglucosamine O-acyltransferase [Hyphomicrobiales bacterium]
MSDVHPTSIVAPGARLGAGVRIGPFCTIGPQVELGEACELVSHVVVAGRTSIGARAKIYPFASLGQAPQDLKYRGEDSGLSVGDDCIIREGVTINTGTAGGGMETRLGARCVLLAYSHVGHDSTIGDDVILSNNVMVAGHVRIGDFAVLSGGVGVHQFSRIGAHAFIGGLSGLEGDLIPFGLALGNRAQLAGLNLIGLRRRNFSRETIAALQGAYRILFADGGVMRDRVDLAAEKFGADANVSEMIAFLRASGDRPICRPPRAAADA